MSRPDGPYGNELLWGDRFLEAYREPLDDLYLTREVRDCVRDNYFAAFKDGEHSMAAEKRLSCASFERERFAETVYPFWFIINDVTARGYSRNSAMISIQAAMMLYETDVVARPSKRHVSADVKPPDGHAAEPEERVDPSHPGEKRGAEPEGRLKSVRPRFTPNKGLAPDAYGSATANRRKRGPEVATITPEGVEAKCSNCAYSRNPDHCSQMELCDDYRYAGPSPDYWPTWDDERGGAFGDFLSRSNDTNIN